VSIAVTDFSNTTNLFCRENLDIPRPAEEIQHKPASDEELAKANLKNRKSTHKPVPKPTAAMTARYVFIVLAKFVFIGFFSFRNLFLTEFRDQHADIDNASADDFLKAWKGIDKTKLKVFSRRISPF
jgi:hypothetical protein